jgi:hypothetical protein
MCEGRSRKDEGQKNKMAISPHFSALILSVIYPRLLSKTPR